MMKKLNAYYLLYLIPIILVAAATFLLIYLWERLNIFYSVFAILAIVAALIIMTSNVLKAIFSPIKYIGKTDELEIILLKEIKKRDATVTREEMRDLLKKSRGIARSSRSKDEKAMLLDKLIQDFFRGKSGAN